jgi:hypothetical protein
LSTVLSISSTLRVEQVMRQGRSICSSAASPACRTAQPFGNSASFNC